MSMVRIGTELRWFLAIVFILTLLGWWNWLSLQKEYPDRILEAQQFYADEVEQGMPDKDEIDKLIAMPDPARVPELIQKIHEIPPRLSNRKLQERWRLVGAVAACGGSEAAEFLEQTYAEAMVSEISMLPPPYKIWEFPEYCKHFPGALPGWSWDTTVENGVAYSVFIEGYGCFSPTLWLGIDSDCNGLLDEILHTGLSDSKWVSPKKRKRFKLQINAPKHPLRLAVDGSQFSFTYHPSTYDEWYKRRLWWGDDVKSVSVDLASLKKDSDSDGLTDVVEMELNTDPSSMDSDGDGLIDSLDPTPLVDPDSMGYVERGVMRALMFGGSFIPEHSDFETPFTIRQYRIHGAGDVAWSPNTDIYCVAKGVKNNLDGQGVDYWVIHRDEIMNNYNQMRNLDRLHRSAEFSASEAYYFASPELVDYVIPISTSMGSSIIILTDVDGELYPLGNWSTGHPDYTLQPPTKDYLVPY